LNKEITSYIETITKELNLTNKANLNKVHLQITSDNEEMTIINLGNPSMEIDLENESDYLLIKMEKSTFYALRDNKKHPEDLMFEEKIKIKGNLNLLR